MASGEDTLLGESLAGKLVKKKKKKGFLKVSFETLNIAVPGPGTTS